MESLRDTPGDTRGNSMIAGIGPVASGLGGGSQHGEETVDRGRPAEPLGTRPGRRPPPALRPRQQLPEGGGDGRSGAGGGDTGVADHLGEGAGALTTTGVPAASDSSAARPNVSTGPGDTTASAAASTAAPPTRGRAGTR
jgi:hypothetical protein